MAWSDLIGQSDAIATMRAAAEGDGLTHSWLITGPPGSGKTYTGARLIAALERDSASQSLVLEKELGATRIAGGDEFDVPAWKWPAR